MTAAPAKSDRRSELSIANLLFCLLVMLIHCFSAAVTSVSREPGIASAAVYLPWRLSAFVVPGFIFLAGVKLTLGKSGGKTRNWWRYYAGRLRTVLLPYVVWVVIYFVYFYLIGYAGHSGSAAGDLAELAHYLLVGDLSSHFYFVVVIVQFYALAPLFAFLCKRVSGALLVGGSAALMLLLRFALPDLIATVAPGFDFIYNDRVFTTYLFYFVAGACAGAHWEDFCQTLRENRAAVFALAGFFTVLGGLAGYLNFCGFASYSWLELAHICYTPFAILLCLVLALGLRERPFASSRLFALADRSTYTVYLSHCLVLNIVSRALERFGITRLSVSLALRLLLVFTLSLAFSMAWTWLREQAAAKFTTSRAQK